MSKRQKEKNIYLIEEFFGQNIVENNLVEKTKMQDEKDHQTRLIDRLINTCIFLLILLI